MIDQINEAIIEYNKKTGKIPNSLVLSPQTFTELQNLFNVSGTYLGMTFQSPIGLLDVHVNNFAHPDKIYFSIDDGADMFSFEKEKIESIQTSKYPNFLSKLQEIE